MASLTTLFNSVKRRETLFAVLGCAAIVALIDVSTNSLNIVRFANHNWDFRYYIALAKDGFEGDLLASPSAYRYPTPFIAGGISRAFGVSIGAGFKVVALIGAMLQLIGVFMLVRHLAKTTKGAWVAVLVTALSFCNVKFLMFDVYRPDHLAYAFVLAGCYFAVHDKFYLLLITAAVGLQFREFAIAPLLAYLLTLVTTRQWRSLARYAPLTLLIIGSAVALPRLLIHTNVDYQAVPFSVSGLTRFITIPLDFRRDLWLAYFVLAYGLPTIMFLILVGKRSVLSDLQGVLRHLLISYSLIVLALCLYGGSDIIRFTTYFFLPQVFLVGYLSRRATVVEIIGVLVLLFIFNRIWADIPMTSKSAYLNYLYREVSVPRELAACLAAALAWRLGLHRLRRVKEAA